MAKRIVKHKDIGLRDAFKIVDWIEKPEDRRHIYFRWCDQAIETVRGLKAVEEDVIDDAAVRAIQGALIADGTFYAHLTKHGAEFLAEEGGWERLLEIGASVVYHEYLVECENGTWPHEQ